MFSMKENGLPVVSTIEYMVNMVWGNVHRFLISFLTFVKFWFNCSWHDSKSRPTSIASYSANLLVGRLLSRATSTIKQSQTTHPPPRTPPSADKYKSNYDHQRHYRPDRQLAKTSSHCADTVADKQPSRESTVISNHLV